VTVSTNTIETKIAFTVDGAQKIATAFQGFIDKNKTLGGLFRNTVDSLKAINPAAALAVGGLGALTAAGVAATKQAIALADSLLVVADRTGITVEALSGLKFAAEQSNASFSDVQAGLRFLARNADAAAHGNDRAAASFKRIGVNIKDANGNLKTADQLFGDVAEGVSKLSGPMEQAAVSAQLLGRQSGPALVPLLSQGRAGLEAFRKEAEALGLIISTGFARKADEFGDKMNVLKQVSIGFGQVLGDALLPAINDFLGELIRTAPKALENFKVGLLTTNFLLQKFSAFNSIAIQAVIGLSAAVKGNKAALADSNAKMAFFIEQLTQTQEEFLEDAAAAEKHTEALKKTGEGAKDAATSIKELVDALTASDRAIAPVVELASKLAGVFPELNPKFQDLVAGLQGIQDTGPEAAAALEAVHRAAAAANSELSNELAQSFRDLTGGGGEVGSRIGQQLSPGTRRQGERTAAAGEQFLSTPDTERGLQTKLSLMEQIAAVFLEQDLAAQKLNGSLEEGAQFIAGLTTLAFSFGDALFDAATGAKDAFSQFFKQLLKDLLKAIIRATILQAILGVFGGGFSLAKIGASIQKQLGFGGFQDRESSILGRAAQANTFSALSQSAAIAPAVAPSGMGTVGVIIEEPGPFTKATVTDKWVLPRLRQRQRQLNEQGF
jgi:hypothetical protein